LVCAARPGATNNNNRWAEEHLKVGDLFEHAKGSTDKVDPRRKAGTWNAVSTAGSANDVINYNYGTGGTYNWSVWEQTSKVPGAPASVYHFCDGATLVASGATQVLPAATAPNPCGY
jgi:hypothetical protein